MNDRLLTAQEVAQLLNVKESWVREATREGRLPHLKLGRYRRYDRGVIDAWLREQQAGPSISLALFRKKPWGWASCSHSQTMLTAKCLTETE